MPSLERTDTARPRGNAAAAANLLAGVPAPRPPVMRAPIEFGNAAANKSLPFGNQYGFHDLPGLAADQARWRSSNANPHGRKPLAAGGRPPRGDADIGM